MLKGILSKYYPNHQLRIEEAKIKLTNISYNNYTIYTIALECDFKSKSNFYTIFKKHTSQTPNQFKKSI
ncbi:helix-turn-helix domain-containing protein [Aquimarina sp. 2304DJ70-9]|uniref:helix-turn-helix domain-containing protein n=1 Tax=Aquimarina penaris TaxID=3231044 RepID=UPI003461AB76